LLEWIITAAGPRRSDISFAHAQYAKSTLSCCVRSRRKRRFGTNSGPCGVLNTRARLRLARRALQSGGKALRSGALEI
jgi:hypothetical protein